MRYKPCIFCGRSLPSYFFSSAVEKWYTCHCQKNEEQLALFLFQNYQKSNRPDDRINYLTDQLIYHVDLVTLLSRQTKYFGERHLYYEMPSSNVVSPFIVVTCSQSSAFGSL